MSSSSLQKPILDGGVRAVNFFNGRLLSGEDLTQERAANRTVDRRLGQAIGAGVAKGLEVTVADGLNTVAAPVLSVAPGLAVNAQGQTLALAAETTVALVRPDETTSGAAGEFSICQPPQAGAFVTGTGVYLLVLSPTSAGVGRAPFSTLNDAATQCNTRFTVEGVQFRLVQFPLSLTELNDAARLRNLVAASCFGVDDPNRTAFASDPFGPLARGYGRLDRLHADNVLTDCDVPLAAVYWTTSTGISFVDLWSVRRNLTQSDVTHPWSAVTGNRRRSEAEAMFLQFQDHIEQLGRTEQNPELLKLADRFSYLPPAGVVPIADTGSKRGFQPDVFFLSRASNDIAQIDGNLLRLLLRESLDHEPNDLRAPDKLQLYLIRENMLAVQAGVSKQLALVFASPTLPYRGIARFGSARWDLSRFASTVI